MKKRLLLFVFLMSVLTTAGCSGTSRNPETDTDNINVVSESTPFENNPDTGNQNGDSISVREEYQPFYQKYYGLFKNYSDVSQPEEILLKMNEVFNNHYKCYDRVIAYESTNLTETMYSNFITPDEAVLNYDPFALSFYNNQTKLKVNPILMAEKADENSAKKYTTTEYMPFNYNIRPRCNSKGLFSSSLKGISRNCFRVLQQIRYNIRIFSGRKFILCVRCQL